MISPVIRTICDALAISIASASFHVRLNSLFHLLFFISPFTRLLLVVYL